VPRTGLSADEVRERAVEVAADAIRRLGFERVRLVDVARDLGVSHAALYKHFADKTVLLDAVSERWLGEVDATLEKLAQRPNRSAEQRIRDVFLALHRAKRERVLADPALYHAFDTAAEALKPFIVRHLEALQRLLLGLVKEAQGGGEIGKGKAAAIATLLVDATASFTHPKLVSEHAERNRETELQLLLTTVFLGLRA